MDTVSELAKQDFDDGGVVPSPSREYLWPEPLQVAVKEYDTVGSEAAPVQSVLE